MFAREGCTAITISHLPQEREDAQGAKKQIEACGAQVNLVECDLMEEASCKKLVESHIQKFGKLNILVNNASKQKYAYISISRKGALMHHAKVLQKFRRD